MEESKERDRSSTGSKKKEAFLDLDIGKDFLTSWKSISFGEGNDLDFDLTPVPKSNKKPFNMENEDMDFNLDDDFGKMPSFNMDMPDLDISPPLKKDGKANDKAKEFSSFNMDMPDFDLSPPLKDRKASEKGKESTSGNDKRKKDRFPFDFDELGDFDFRSSLRKEDSNAKKDKDKNERSPNKSDHQIKEVLTHKNISSNINNIEDESKKASRQGSLINLGMDSLVCEIQDNEPTENGLPSNLAVDDAIISTVSAESVKVASASDKEKISSESAIVSMGLSPSTEKLVTTEVVGLASETCLAKAALQDLQPSCIPGDGTVRGNTSEADKVEYMDTSPTRSNAKLDVKLLPTSSTCKNTVSGDSQHLQTETSEKNADEASGVEDHVRERTGPGEVSSLAETFCDSSALPGVLCDTPSTNESHKPASSILNLSLKSKQAGISDKHEGTKSITTDSISSVQSEKAECTSKILSAPEIVSSISTRKAGVIQPSLLEVKRGLADHQLDKRLVSVSLPSKSIFPRTHNQEGCKDMKIIGERCRAGESPDVEKNNDSSLTKNKTLVEIKTTPQGQETSLKDLGTLSMETKKTAQNAGNETPLVSFSATKNVPAGRMRLSSLEGGKKVPELSGLKHSGAEIAKRAAKNVGYAKPLASFPTMNHVLAQEKRLSLFEGDKKVPDLCGLKLSGMKVTEKAARNARDAMPLSSSPKVEHVSAEKKSLSSFGGGKKVPDIYGQKLSGMEIAEKAAQNAADATPLSLFPTMKHVPAEERTLSSFGVGGKRAPVFHPLKFASLNVGHAKSPTEKDIKSAKGIDQSNILSRKTLLDTTTYPDSKKQMPSILPMKRKTLGVDAAAVISLQSSKRCFQPLKASSSRNFTGKSEKVPEEKASNHSNMEGDTVDDHSEAAMFIGRHEKIKGLEISFSTEDNCNIKQAEAYCKELDDLSSILRKKHDEAKEVLVQATVNSNKLLLLNSPLFEQKISAQKLLARLSLDSTDG